MPARHGAARERHPVRRRAALPGGSIERGASPLEKHYVVLSGEVTIVTDDGEAALGPWDSVRLAPGEARALENRSDAPAAVLLAMPLPPA